MDTDTFIRDRNEALLSLDEARIRAYAAKWGEKLPDDPEAFWRGVHKAITAIPALPLDFRRRSKAWLDARDSKSFDDGGLNAG